MIDPGVGVVQSIPKQELNMTPESLGGASGQSVHKFDDLVGQINPNQAFMDPETLALMKSRFPDGNMASALMDSVRWLRKSVDGTFNDINQSLDIMKAKETGDLTAVDVLDLQMRAGSFTFVMSMTSNIVSKSTTHLDTLLKAQ